MLACAYLLVTAFGVTGAVLIGAGFVGGAAALPILSLIVGPASRRLGEGLGSLWLTVGLRSFEDPVVNLDADSNYRVVEADELGIDGGPRYKLAKTLVGFDCARDVEAFGHAGHTSSDLVDYLPSDGLVAADGGASVLPRGMAATDQIRNAEHYGMLPDADHLDDHATYVRTDHWLSRFRDAATGRVADRAQQEATREFAGGDPPISDHLLMLGSVGLAAVGFGFWLVIALA